MASSSIRTVRWTAAGARTLRWVPQAEGVYPFYCTDFCSALHQEMQGYVRVSPAGSNTPLKWSVGKPAVVAQK